MRFYYARRFDSGTQYILFSRQVVVAWHSVKRIQVAETGYSLKQNEQKYSTTSLSVDK